MFRRFAFVLALTLAAAPSRAQSPFAFVKWRSIGPVNTSGRIDDFAVARVRGEPDAIYVGHRERRPLEEREQRRLVVARLRRRRRDDVDRRRRRRAVVADSPCGSAPAKRTRARARVGATASTRSTDGGKTWANMGLKDTRSIARIVIDPPMTRTSCTSPRWAICGARTPSAASSRRPTAARRGTKVLFVDENTGATDLVIDPRESAGAVRGDVSASAAHVGLQRRRPGIGIYKTTDGGATWTKLTTGLPAGDKGRIGLSLYATDPKVVYATSKRARRTAASIARVDAGATWEKTSSLNTRPNYYSQIRIDPKDRERIYTLGSNRGFYFSNDGGKTFTELFSNVHGEDHALWIDPPTRNHLIIGGDGGVSISWDRGRTWDFRRNMPLGQFYEIDVDNSVPFRICGGLQDNGVWCVPSAVRNRNGIADRDAWNIGGGDGFHAHFDPHEHRARAAVVAERQRRVGEHRDARAAGRAARDGRSSRAGTGWWTRPRRRGCRGGRWRS